jgi:hypothetical protein
MRSGGMRMSIKMFNREKCLEIVRGNLGEGFDHLCEIREVTLYKHPVIGWLVTIHHIVGEEGESEIVDAKPLILFVGGSFEFREAEMSIDLGYFPDREDLDLLGVHYKLDKFERVVGVLPSWPNIYYVTGYVNNIAFSLGVYVNPNDEELKEFLLNAYLDWLGGPEVRDLKSKLAELKTGT